MEGSLHRWLVLLLFWLTTASTVPLLEPDNHLHAEETNLRARRRVADSTSSVIHYMEELRNSLTDRQGKPKLTQADDPTEVWAMRDRDILNNIYRKKPKSSARCTSENLFIFNWESLTESQQHKTLPVEKAILRAHLKVIQRHLNRDGPTHATLDVYVRRHGSSTRFHAGEKSFEVTAASSGWMELNITKGVRSMWPLRSNESLVEVSVIFKSNCSRKSPVIFEDASSVSLSQTKKRERLSAFQPLFVVFLSDESVKEIVRNETALSGEDYENYNDDVSEVEGESSSEGTRQKRQADSKCGVEDFELSFHDLGLTYVAVPHSYNARQCKGSCSHRTLGKNGNLANNHAKLLASASKLAESKPELFRIQPEAPCCVPTKYASATIVTMRKDGSYKYVVYSHMVVTECGCR